MTISADTQTPIDVVPHFSRLHEWVALEESYYQEEGLEPRLLADVMHGVSSHHGDPYGHRPQDRPFVSQSTVANSACEWGSACNAGAGMGRFVKELYTVGRFAIFARPGSNIEMLCELRDQAVGIGEMAGSHFTSLQMLEHVIPKGQILLKHAGGPGQRLISLLDGEVEAANLLDPEIPIAEAKGLKKLGQGEFKITFWVSATLDPSLLGAFLRALKRAERALDENAASYLHLWERNIPPALAGDWDYARFGRGERLIDEPYTESMFNEAVSFASRWGLDDHMKSRSYDGLAAAVAL